jgi:hypothetical protein
MYLVSINQIGNEPRLPGIKVTHGPTLIYAIAIPFLSYGYRHDRFFFFECQQYFVRSMICIEFVNTLMGRRSSDRFI